MNGILDTETVLHGVLPAVLEAGRIQSHLFRTGVAVETKADRSPVTLADQQSEAVLLAALATVAAQIPVVAEESVALGNMPTQLPDQFFLVDPLDGTREFINGRPEFTINIALIAEGRPVFGLIYAPITGEFFATVKAGMACATRFDPAEPDATVRAKVAAATPIQSRPPPPTGMIAMTSRSHTSPETRAYLAHFPVSECRHAGSSLKFCRIACGQADIYPRLGETCEWDIAAGHAILAAAGGSVQALNGSALQYGKHAARFLNPHFVARGLMA